MIGPKVDGIYPKGVVSLLPTQSPCVRARSIGGLEGNHENEGRVRKGDGEIQQLDQEGQGGLDQASYANIPAGPLHLYVLIQQMPQPEDRGRLHQLRGDGCGGDGSTIQLCRG